VADTQVDTRVLYQYGVDNIPYTTAAYDRERNNILMNGWRVKLYAKNIASPPLTLRWAIIQNKQGVTPTSANGLVQFFQGPTSIELGVAFSTSRTGLEMNTLPINRKVYNVIKTGRFTTAGAPTSGVNSGAYGNAKQMAFYIPYNKKITYDSDLAALPFLPMHFVYWVDIPDTAASGLGNTNVMRFTLDIVASFHDVA
jgi:hypothetical protein